MAHRGNQNGETIKNLAIAVSYSRPCFERVPVGAMLPGIRSERIQLR